MKQNLGMTSVEFLLTVTELRNLFTSACFLRKPDNYPHQEVGEGLQDTLSYSRPIDQCFTRITYQLIQVRASSMLAIGKVTPFGHI